MTADETAAVPDTPGENIPEDDLFEVFRNDRRRELIRILDAERHCKLPEVSLQLAALENDHPEGEVTGQQKKRVYVALYQTHLPKLDRLGVVIFDKDGGIIQRGEAFQDVSRVLAAADDAAEDTDAGLVERLLGGVFA